LFLPLMFHTSPKSLAAHWMLVILIGGVCQAAITGGVLLLLLPPVSGVHVGFGTTFIAVLVGNVITIGGTLLMLHATVQSHLAAVVAASVCCPPSACSRCCWRSSASWSRRRSSPTPMKARRRQPS